MEHNDAHLNQHLPKVGVVGVGLLGKAIAGRLIDQGYSVAGYDPVACHATDLQFSDSLTELVQKVEIVLLCLPDSGIAAQVIEDGYDLFLDHQVVVDTTTGSPDEMIAMGHKLARRNVSYLEANVAGSSQQMLEGKATLFVGGDARFVELNGSLFDAISTQWFHLGSLGAGSRFKLVHNMVLGLNRLVLAEGLEFASSLGMDGVKTLEILKRTPAYSNVMDSKGDRMVYRDFENPQARLSQHLKDVCLMIDQAQASGGNIPLTTLHQQLLERAEELGFGACDNSAIIEGLKPNLSKNGLS
ncbi:NAD(P)-dependent oxidoreductase [Verrucomicrobia bacterium]|jgi:3-hydroxyisobutyrate dehydrogenase-like beta-hydroxyacid dehydrogenase|nr:NAD(P)-dependent oxidoreductase [Verrucomicrobiota bacterium]